MMSMIKKSILMTGLLVVITCGVYPAAVWIVGQIVFHDKSNGSVLSKNGSVVGSRLIGQGFSRPEYFHPRVSSAGDKGYDGTNSGATNLSLTNKKYQDALGGSIKKVLEENPQLKKGQIPPDMVTTSASGLDPDISIENATAQASRVATTRRLKIEDVRSLIEKNIQGPTLKVLGPKYVNVLELNLALGEMLKASK